MRAWKLVNGNIITNAFMLSNSQAVAACIDDAQQGDEEANAAILEANWTWLHDNRCRSRGFLSYGDITERGIEAAKNGDALAQRLLRLKTKQKLIGDQQWPR